MKPLWEHSYFEEGATAAIRLESRNANDGDVVQKERTRVDLDGTGEQSRKILDVPRWIVSFFFKFIIKFIEL